MRGDVSPGYVMVTGGGSSSDWGIRTWNARVGGSRLLGGRAGEREAGGGGASVRMRVRQIRWLDISIATVCQTYEEKGAQKRRSCITVTTTWRVRGSLIHPLLSTEYRLAALQVDAWGSEHGRERIV